MKINKKYLVWMVVIIIAGIIFWLSKLPAKPSDQQLKDNTIVDSPTPERPWELGGHICLDMFRTRRDATAPTKKEPLGLSTITVFRSGAFTGKIKDFGAGDNQKFAELISQLMKENRIPTFIHTDATVCLYNADSLNPENGASLLYYIEHHYYTNTANTGKYDLRIDLDAYGNFVGYRTDPVF